MTTQHPRGAIAFAEKVVELLDAGRIHRRTSTRCFSGCLCLEGADRSGSAPQMVTTRQLAEKAIQLYWPHTLAFVVRTTSAVPRQNTTGQAEIVSLIGRFREQNAPDLSATHWRSRLAAPDAYERLVGAVEWKLIEMPLPRVQNMGGTEQAPFIYIINWNAGIIRDDVTRYQQGEVGVFDNRILLLTGVGDYLVQLSGLLRPLIQRHWAAFIAQLNRLEESQLETFLFGAVRVPTARVRAGPWEIQGKRCFYCDARLKGPAAAHVDHFVPWSRYPDDGLDNFVVTDRQCNGWKSNSLAAHGHLARWTRRFSPASSENAQLRDLAAANNWIRRPNASLGVARAIYPRLPSDARLWLIGRDFVTPDGAAIAAALDLRADEPTPT